MPPTKRKASDDGGAAVAEKRVTRGATRQLLANSVGDSVKKDVVVVVVEKKSKKKAKKVGLKTTTQMNETTTDEPKIEINGDDSKAPTVVIEHCKQCNQFKVRALQVQKGLEEGVPGITVLINPEKPRRGCFEIRVEGGQKFISLLDMKRPFKPMTDLIMEEVIADIVGKIKA